MKVPKVHKEIGIIGGGISGLYAAHMLYKCSSNLSISIYEKASYWGGRIRTIVYDREVMDTGAGRFNKKHTLLIALIKEFKLQEYMFKLNTRKQFIKDGKTIDFHTLKYINMAIKKASTESKKRLTTMTFDMFLREFLPDSIVIDMISAFGYVTEFENMNAYEAITLFKNDFVQDIDYFSLKGGLSRIVNTLVDSLKSKGCKMYLNSDVEDTYLPESNSGRSIVVNGKTITYDHVYFCLPKSGLVKFFGNCNGKGNSAKFLNAVGAAPLHRIYAKFPVSSGEKVWFHGLPKVTTNGLLGTIIPLNYDTGFVMISYTDGRAAEKWRRVGNLKDHIMLHLRKMFPGKDIPDPLWVKNFYWSEGIHYWHPGASVAFKGKGEKYTICGEVMEGHGWIEGALRSVNKHCSF